MIMFLVKETCVKKFVICLYFIRIERMKVILHYDIFLLLIDGNHHNAKINAQTQWKLRKRRLVLV